MSTVKKSELTILRDDAVALCVALKFKTAGSWNKQRMLRKLKDLAEMVEDGGIEVDPEDSEDHDRLNKLLKSIAGAGGVVNVVQELPSEEEDEVRATEDIEVEEDEPPVAEEAGSEAEEETVEDEKAETAQEEPAEKPKKKGRRGKRREKQGTKSENPKDVGKDRFNSRIGTQSAQINAVLESKGKTIDQICEDSGLKKARVRSHIKWLVDRDFVTFEENVVKVK